MLARWKRSWELLWQSFAVLRHHPRLLVFPLIAGAALIAAGLIGLLVAFTAGMIGQAPQTGAGGSSFSFGGYLALFLVYLVASTIAIFCNTALVGSAMRLLRGEPASVGGGFSIAIQVLPQILLYALLSATLGVLARAILDRGRNSGNPLLLLGSWVVGRFIQGSWALVTFMFIPVLIAERGSTARSMRESWELLRRTWGENVLGNVGMGFVGGVIALGIVVSGIIMLVISVASGIAALTVLTVVVGAGSLLLLILSMSALNGIFRASLYQYATTGDAGPFIDAALARDAFAPRRRRFGWFRRPQ